MRWFIQFVLLLLLSLAPIGAFAQSDDAAPAEDSQPAEDSGQDANGKTETTTTTVSFASQLAAWDRTAEQTQLLLDSVDASDEQLLNFRKALNNNRVAANQYVLDTQEQVQDLQSQLEALTPTDPTATPDDKGDAEPQPESDELKQRRANVEAQLALVQGNVLSANQIVKEANSLIDQIDARLRQNYYNDLLSRGRVPISWDSVQLSAYGIYQTASTVWAEIKANYAQARDTGLISERWPTAIFFMVVSLFIVFWTPKFARMQLRRDRPWGTKWQRVLMPLAPSFVVIIALPVALQLFRTSLEITELIGANGKILVQSVGLWAHFVLVAIWLKWLIEQVDGGDIVHRRRFGRSLYFLAFLLGFSWTLDDISHIAGVDSSALATINFLIIIMGALALWNLTSQKYYARLFGIEKLHSYPRLKHILRQAMRYGIILTIFLSTIGYFAASYQLFRAILVSGFMVFWGIHFSRFVINWIAIVINEFKLSDDDDVDVDDKLWPILIQFGVWLVSIPIVLMAWGVPQSTIIELWSRLRQGLSLGDIDISFTGLLKLAITLYIGYILVNAFKKMMERSVLARTKLDMGARAAVVSLMGYVGYTIVALIGFSVAGFNLSAIGYIAGALSVGIGFGLQNIVQNFISGLILLVERPVKKGDWIKVGSSEGYVQNIAVRSTAIRTFDDSTIIVPNADLITNPVVNWFHDNQTARVTLTVGVSYEADPERVEAIMLEIVEGSTYKRRDPNASVVIRELADSSVTYELRFWINDADWITRARSEMFFAVLKRFKEEGVEIPFPQRDVHIKEAK